MAAADSCRAGGPDLPSPALPPERLPSALLPPARLAQLCSNRLPATMKAFFKVSWSPTCSRKAFTDTVSSWYSHFLSFFKNLAALGLSHSTQDLHCSVPASSVATQELFFSCGTLAQWLQCLGLVALRCVGSYFPDQRLNPCPLHWKEVCNHWTTREAPQLVVSLAHNLATTVSHIHLVFLGRLQLHQDRNHVSFSAM